MDENHEQEERHTSRAGRSPLCVLCVPRVLCAISSKDPLAQPKTLPITTLFHVKHHTRGKAPFVIPATSPPRKNHAVSRETVPHITTIRRKPLFAGTHEMPSTPTPAILRLLAHPL